MHTIDQRWVERAVNRFDGGPAEMFQSRPTRSATAGDVCVAALLLFVAAVSVYDAALVVLLEEVIGDFERNPAGRVLIDLGQGNVWPFVLVKLAGTAVVCAAVVVIYRHKRFEGLAIATSLATFQLGLLLYLSLG